MKRAAECYFSAGELEKAASLYEQLQMWAEAGSCFEKIKAWEKAGNCFTETGQFRKALSLYRMLPSKKFKVLKFISRATVINEKNMKKLLEDEGLDLMRSLTDEKSGDKKAEIVA